MEDAGCRMQDDQNRGCRSFTIQQSSDIRHPTSDILHPTSSIRHPRSLPHDRHFW
jgi:hypothetical protein